MDGYRLTLTSLSQITEQPSDSVPLPDHVRSWLESDLRIAKTEFHAPEIPPGTMGQLIPSTKLVVRTKPFIWQLAKLFISAVILLQSKGGMEVKSGIVIAIIETLKNLKGTMIKLDENLGEHCIYLAIAKKELPSAKPDSSNDKYDEVIEKHQEIKRDCTVVRCCFFDLGCKLKDTEGHSIIDSLARKRVIELKSNVWKPIL